MHYSNILNSSRKLQNIKLDRVKMQKLFKFFILWIGL